jgi:cytoskeletal protein RodZ
MENNTVTSIKSESANHVTAKDAERDFAYQAWLEDKAFAKKEAAEKAREEAAEAATAESNQRIAEAVYGHQQYRAQRALRRAGLTALTVAGLAAAVVFTVVTALDVHSAE